MKGITGNPALEAYQRVALTPVNPTQPASEATPAHGERPTSGEAAKVTISAQARELAAGGDEQVNAEKVESLKSAIADGSFKVDSNLVAERILDTVG
jgi:negative regulator of flagellin synthesis FlgM